MEQNSICFDTTNEKCKDFLHCPVYEILEYTFFLQPSVLFGDQLAGDNCIGLTSNGSFLVDNCRLDGFYKATLLYHRQELGLDHVNRFFIMERVTVLMKLTCYRQKAFSSCY